LLRWIKGSEDLLGSGLLGMVDLLDELPHRLLDVVFVTALVQGLQ
jgi:hypothetical protein